MAIQNPKHDIKHRNRANLKENDDTRGIVLNSGYMAYNPLNKPFCCCNLMGVNATI